MSKNVTEYGKDISDILRDTPNSLRDLQGLINFFKFSPLLYICGN